MSSEKAQVVEKFLGAFASGDLQGALACFDATTEVIESEGLPFSGTYIGVDGFMEILGKMSAHLEPTVNSAECLDAGDTVVGKINITFTNKDSGRSCTTDVVELYTVEDGVIKRADVYYKNPGGVTDLVS